MSVRALSSANRYRPIIYVVAAEQTTRLICDEILARKHAIPCDVRGYPALADGMAAFERVRPALLLTDGRFGRDSAQPLLALAAWGDASHGIPSIVLAEANEHAAAYISMGATDVLWKPLRAQRVIEVVGMALDAATGRRVHTARAAAAPTRARAG